MINPVGNLTAVAAVPAQSAPQPLTDEQRSVIQAVKAVNAAELFGEDNELTFILDRASNRPALRIVSKSTHEVVAQIPAESVLQLAEELKRK